MAVPSRPDGKKCDWNDVHLVDGLGEVKKQIAITVDVAETGRRFRLRHVGTLQVRPPSWVIRGMIEADSLVVLFGAPGSLKSFMGIAWMCHIATGIDFGGRPVRQGHCVYICGEGQNGIARRFGAWCTRNGIETADLQITVSTVPAYLCEADQVQMVINEIRDAARYYGEPVMVVIDTLSRNFGGDENQTVDMVRYVGALDQIRAEYGSTIIVIHHSGLADKTRSRGSMALQAGADTVFKIEKIENQNIVTLEAMKMKDSMRPEPISFRPAVVELGMDDEDGEPVTSLVLDEVGGVMQAGDDAARPGGKWQRLSIETLRVLISEHVARLDDAGLSSTARVLVGDWRDACARAGLSDRRAWKKVIDSLSKSETIIISGRYVSMAGG